jgi:hypothetical protein
LNSNAAIVPVVYFFYPETAYRSLEEMDTIFQKSTSVWDVVRVAKETPRRYGKRGEVLIDYEEHQGQLGGIDDVRHGEKDTSPTTTTSAV